MLSPDSKTKIELGNLRPSLHNRGKRPIIVFVLGVAVSFLTMGVSNNSKVKTSVEKSETQAIVKPLNEDIFTTTPKSTYLEILFGEFAVAKCIQSCNIKQREYINSCKDECNRLQLINYGRRSSVDSKNVAKDVNEVISKCTETKIKFPTSSSNTQWEINTQKIITNALGYENQCREVEKDLVDLRILNNILINSSNFLSLNPTQAEGKEIDKDLIRNLASLFCLYTKIAIKIAEQNMDSAGADYYKNFVTGLSPKSTELKNIVLKEATELKFKN